MSATTVEPGIGRIGAAVAALVSAAALALPGPALAATALTGEIQLNQATTGFQENPEISMLPGGQFSVVWEDVSNADAVARSFSPSIVPLGNEFGGHPSSFGQGVQDNPQVGLDSAGGLKTTWDGLNGPLLGDGSSETGDKAVLFSRAPAAGPASGGGIVNTTLAGNQDSPAIAARPGGEFAVAWESFSATAGAFDDVYARRYDAAGIAVDGAEVLINSGAAPVAQNQGDPSISADGSGNYVVGFEGVDGGADLGIFARYFRSNGTVVGPSSVPTANIPVNESVNSAGDQFDVDIATDTDGRFTAVWTGPDTGGTTGIFARRFQAHPSGAPIDIIPGAPFDPMPDTPVNQVTAGAFDSLPAVATDGNGNFVVAWYRGTDVFARTFDSLGNPTNDEIKVNTTATLLCGCSGLSVGMDSDKNFVVVWEADAPGGAVDDEIFARRFSTVTIPPSGGGGGGGGGSTTPPANAALLGSTKAVRVGRDRRYGVQISCPAGGLDCAGSVSAETSKAIAPAKKRIIRLGSADFSVAAGQTQKSNLRLSRKALKLLKDRKRLGTTITVTTQTPNDPLESSGALRIKAPKG